jgi:hypothetical protein
VQTWFETETGINMMKIKELLLQKDWAGPENVYLLYIVDNFVFNPRLLPLHLSNMNLNICRYNILPMHARQCCQAAVLAARYYHWSTAAKISRI